MKRLLLFATILAVVALASAPAFAAVKYINGTTTANAVAVGVAQTDGQWTAGSAFPDGWSASSAVSSVRYNTSPYNRTYAAYNSTSGQAGYAEIQVSLAIGYWTIAATQSGTSLGTGAKAVSSLAGWVGLPATTTMFSTGNAWNTMGTYKTTVATPKIRFDENGTTTNRWYLDQLRFTSATPTKVTNVAPANGATGVALTGTSLTWIAGSYNSFFDVFCDTNANPTTLVGSNLVEGTTSQLLSPLASSTTYYWKVVAKNVDNSAAGDIWSFTTVPEPGSLLALGTGLLGLFGFIRRRRA